VKKVGYAVKPCGLGSIVAQAHFIFWSSVVRSQGAYRPWKVTEIKIQIFQAWKVMESGLDHVKSWKTNQMVASFSPIVLVLGLYMHYLNRYNSAILT